jgi:2-haloacid dehalogenase
VDTVNGHYHDFGSIGKVVMRMTAQLLNKPVPDDKQTQLLGIIRQRPLHPDVKEGLTQLQQARFRLVTLTNSAGQAAKDQ